MPGPVRKDPRRRQRVDSAGVGLTIVQGALSEPPEPPRQFLAETKATWTAFWSSELIKVVNPQTDAMALVRLFSLYDERTRAYRVLHRSGDRVVEGSKGQPVLNPLYAAISAMDPEIRQLEDRFGLSPRSRLNLGVKLGEAARSLADLRRDLDSDDPDAEADEDAADSRTLAVEAVAPRRAEDAEVRQPADDDRRQPAAEPRPAARRVAGAVARPRRGR